MNQEYTKKRKTTEEQECFFENENYGKIEKKARIESDLSGEENSSIDEIDDSIESPNTIYNIAFSVLLENLKSKEYTPIEIFKTLGIVKKK